MQLYKPQTTNNKQQRREFVFLSLAASWPRGTPATFVVDLCSIPLFYGFDFRYITAKGISSVFFPFLWLAVFPCSVRNLTEDCLMGAILSRSSLSLTLRPFTFTTMISLFESLNDESCRLDQIESNRQQSQPSCAIFYKSRGNRLPVSRIDSRVDDSCRFDWMDTNRNIFNPHSKTSCATYSQVSVQVSANRLPVSRIDSKGDDSSRFRRIESNRQHFYLRRTRRIDSIKQGSRIDFRLVESLKA